MPLGNSSAEKIQSILSQIKKIVPDTRSILVKQLQSFQTRLNMGELSRKERDDLEETCLAAERLIQNLHLAKTAAKYSANRLITTNRPDASGDDVQLKKIRKQLNETELLQIFNTLKNRRNELGRQTLSFAEFEQTAYRKGTGTNIAMWYRYATDRKNKKPGNCTEHSNLAFVYIYTIVREEISEHHSSPIDCIYRIDVDNDMGGHSYLLIDGIQSSKFNSQKQYSAKQFLCETKNFNNTCVVVDPWNKEHPYYPISDILDNMPRCGLTGQLNIEFGLDFSEREEPRYTIT
ncbi:hypothetical protein [Legionella nagasakiensis]|uniref:hypothetical protein n=1 Tax=Legionella nagasakiensis TaxID=535290 RepID=UPI001054920B|nr:hypothetical protein [Legionella nagasakiensis]